jgi:DNA invertase Pin-like site-specific DNA recombinase
MKLAMYIRVSKRDMNPENQERQLIKYCMDKGYEYEIFEEKESTRNTRPIKQLVMAHIRTGSLGGVIIWKLDRWARSLQELVMDINEITARNKQFIVVTQPIDTTTASGRLQMQILSAFAEFEREMIRERTIAGLERAKAQGKKLGRPRKRKVINRGGFKYKLEE